jgi:hypothetical protein
VAVVAERARGAGTLLYGCLTLAEPFGMARDRLTELVTTYPVLGNALRELTERGVLTHATADAMGTYRLPSLRLAEFLSLAARGLPRDLPDFPPAVGDEFRRKLTRLSTMLAKLR